MRYHNKQTHTLKTYIHRISRLALAFTFAVLSVNLSGALSSTTYAADPDPNPSLVQTCGLDIALVVDKSSSIGEPDRVLIRQALAEFVTTMSSSPTQFSVTHFGTDANLVQGFTADSALTIAAINSLPPPPGFFDPMETTNWEAGINTGQATFASATGNPDILLLLTDGDPTISSAGPYDWFQPNAHLDPAIVAANAAKASGTRVVAVGIGSSVDVTVSRLQAISGTNVDTGDATTSDVITTDFDQLAVQLADFANQTCGNAINIVQKIDLDGNPATTNDQTNAADWAFDVRRSDNSLVQSTVTQASPLGTVPSVKVTPTGGYSVTQTAKAGYQLVSVSCTGGTNNGAQNGNAISGIALAANNIVTCTFISTPSIIPGAPSTGLPRASVYAPMQLIALSIGGLVVCAVAVAFTFRRGRPYRK